MLRDKKAALQNSQKELRRLEREIEAGRLRAERAEIQAELYQSQAASLKEELQQATTQLEALQKQHMDAPHQAVLQQITLRGKGVSRHLERQASKVEMNVAALTAELEALELTPRNEDEEESGGSVSDVLLMSPRGDVMQQLQQQQQAANQQQSNNNNNANQLTNVPVAQPVPVTLRGRAARPPLQQQAVRQQTQQSQLQRYQALVSELASDNDVLQREYLELALHCRALSAAVGASSSSSSSVTASVSGTSPTPSPAARKKTGWFAGRRASRAASASSSIKKTEREGGGGGSDDDYRSADEATDGMLGRVHDNELALLRAARAKLENVLRETLTDKQLLEAALVQEIKLRR